ncbi:hypothetical protein [Photobacterium kishitanii]|uniref:Uncharacterized protein n=1 Tax=Photobacterium kishitanii TaxID=318456 RepID=A0A2T3KM98_9GAMM|nr:hypothetical protein [Photobacterium kishitanii]PSV00923.1 hypothetical protein C9J27_02530 [Photobacterium kishitanii]
MNDEKDKNKIHFNYFPELVLLELPENLRKNIGNHEEFEITEQEMRVSCGFLDRVLLHPENICETELALIDLLSFYMKVGAKIPTTTRIYVRNHINSAELNRKLAEYENVSVAPTVKINSSVTSQGPMRIFSNVNADMGMKRRNIYAENFSKLAKNIQLWVDSESSSYLRNDTDYAVEVDGISIGAIVSGRTFRPRSDTELSDFITKYFESPVDIQIDINIENGGLSIRDSLNFYCFVAGALKQSLSVVLPHDDDLKLAMIKGEIVEMVTSTVNLKRFQESFTADINATVFVNGIAIASMSPGNNILNYVETFDCEIFDIIGVKRSESFCRKEAKKKSSFFKKLKSFMFKNLIS